MTTVTLLYPSGHKFDMDYYLSKHMKIVQENWGSLGLQSWEILQFPEDAPYQVQATLKWDSLDSYKAAASGPSATAVFGDIPNYTTAKPVSLAGVQKAASPKI
ncbi:hypothetical protein VHEMI01863 [[Torrubiella] hemipterigena]|uniref:Ethyl tert-butyl ether degradation EthD n=1 Tax=[Torrubiella] hemipterigena TaxID=1531966 RepID=A0A0A1T6J3_9HYPO|nr:hypothetical protein VHEMI01863 [[Torrubiella] hemipterigena]